MYLCVLAVTAAAFCSISCSDGNTDNRNQNTTALTCSYDPPAYITTPSSHGGSGVVASPLYGVSSYTPGTRCRWVISAQNHQVLRYAMDYMSLEEGCSDHVQVLYLPHQEPSTTYCGSGTRTGSPRFSTSDHIAVVFVTDYIQQSEAAVGFKLRYAAVDESIDFESSPHFHDVTLEDSPSGYKLYSPGYVSDYLPSLDHGAFSVWVIQAPDGQEIVLDFEFLSLEAQDHCIYDYLDLRAGTNTLSSTQPPVRVCHIPDDETLNNNNNNDNDDVTDHTYTLHLPTSQVVVLLRSDAEVNSMGFMAGIRMEAVAPTIPPPACGGEVSQEGGAAAGVITSPDVPLGYHGYVQCEWVISVPQLQALRLTVYNFTLQHSSSSNPTGCRSSTDPSGENSGSGGTVTITDTATGYLLDTLCTGDGTRTQGSSDADDLSQLVYMASSHQITVRYDYYAGGESDNQQGDGAVGLYALYEGYDVTDEACTGQTMQLYQGFLVLLPTVYGVMTSQQCYTLTWRVDFMADWMELWAGETILPDCTVASLSLHIDGRTDDMVLCGADALTEQRNYLGHTVNPVTVTLQLTSTDAAVLGQLVHSPPVALYVQTGRHSAGLIACSSSDLQPFVVHSPQTQYREVTVEMYTDLHTHCTVLVQPAHQQYLELNLGRVITSDESCNVGRLDIQDGEADDNSFLRVCANQTIPYVYTSSTGYGITLTFVLYGAYMKTNFRVRSVETPGEPAGVYPSCDADLLPVNLTSGDMLTSLYFPQPYPNRICQRWLILAPDGEIPVVVFHSFIVEQQELCSYDRLSAYSVDHQYVRHHIGDYCGVYDYLKVKATTSALLLVFETDRYTTERGFNATVLIEDSDESHICDERIVMNEGESYTVLVDPDTGLYHKNQICEFLMQAQDDKLVELHISTMDIEYSTGCVYDALTLYDGAGTQHNETTAVHTATLCGTLEDTIRYSRSDVMLASFTSDGSVEGQGVNISFISRDPSTVPWLQCGVPSTQARIVGGHKSTPHSLPWLVSLVLAHSTATNWPFCSGAIVGPRTIITAAHCVENYLYSDILVRTGVHDFMSTHNTQTLSVASVRVHPDYVTTNTGNDVALLTLDEDVVYGETASPVCLPTAPPSDWQSCVVAGWGTLWHQGPQPHELHEVEVPLVPHAVCSQIYPNVNPSMLCAGDVEHGGVDACQGDSGSPLVCLDSSTGRYVLHGIVSYGVGCGSSDHPGVYASVYHQVQQQWIDDSVIT